MTQVPAYSAAFAEDARRSLDLIVPMEDITPEWAWGGSTGRGVKVAVLDSGIEASHPAMAGGVNGYLAIGDGPNGLQLDTEPHEDLFGHGTACAGIIRSIAPECELYSVRVLGPTLGGLGSVFAVGLSLAIEHGMQVCNLSLGTTVEEMSPLLHRLADMAYFRNTMLVTAANNMPIPSFPSVYASVISVASHEGQDPYCFYYNPEPPVEFGAPGIAVRVAWRDGTRITATGNSFAAPHITGIVAKILGKHPDLTMFQMKVILRALSANMTRQA